MTCTKFGDVIVCTNPFGRIKLGNRYIWIDYHAYCGPAFYRDSKMEKPYEPADENDPVWAAFEAWLTKQGSKK